MQQLVECIPNFSEGRRTEVVDRIVEAIRRDPEIGLLDRSMDPDHNRSVLTFAGPPASVSAAAVRAVSVAAQWIDLRLHRGVHPRIGAADVVPFVPIRGMNLAACAELAASTGEAIWNETGIPVYLYEAAARIPQRRRLENIRRGGLEQLASQMPDFGTGKLHPTAGACAVGARKFLIACNINLDTDDVSIASRIAKQIRESSGGLQSVKALGLSLDSQGKAQVSINLTDFETTSLDDAFDAVDRAASQAGTAIAATELIGLIPRAAVRTGRRFLDRYEDWNNGKIVEERIAQAMPLAGDV